jgi:thiosulfate/3-mercaptopyruvate sulfurtransferase
MSKTSSDPVIEPVDIVDFGPAAALDVRDQSMFSAGRLEGARRVPIERWEAAAREPTTSLANVSFWEAEIGALGVGNDMLTVVYDDGRMTEAARVWFILQHFGATVRIVNGGWPGLVAAIPDRIVTEPSVPVSPTPFKAQARPGTVGLVQRDQLRAEIGAGTRVFDARTPAEYSGQDLRKNVRGGHLPGAVHLAHADLLADGRLRPPAEIESLLNSAGFQPGDRIVTHCDGGGRAALAAVAAVRAGYADIHAYYLSFADWAKDESCPITRG